MNTSLNTLLKTPAPGSTAAPETATPVLQVSGLQVGFPFKRQTALAISHLDFSIGRGETLGLVGESGCGKSLSALAIMRLIPRPGRVLAGSIKFHGQELLQLRRKAMRRIRGNNIAMIFQDPMTALNPVYTVGDQLTEPLRLHRKMGKKEAEERAAFMLAEVGLPNPSAQLARYPHELSGGQRQRVMIAMALSCEPDLLIADEPTTALDVTIQAQILELMQALQEKYRTGILLITHDLGVIAEIAHRVAVMYAGDVVESGPVEALFDNPAHPYTRGLLAAIPSLANETGEQHRLNQIPGRVPSLLEMPPGCRFQNRCQLAAAPCQHLPAMRWADNAPDHGWRCHFVEQPV